MLLITHIIIALTSVALSTIMIFFPSKTKVRLTYGLMAATIGTGTYLVWSRHAQILQSCMTGLAYVAIVSVGIGVTHYRLAHAQVNT